MQYMLILDPAMRYDAEQSLQHPFIRDAPLTPRNLPKLVNNTIFFSLCVIIILSLQLSH